jgi:quercetin dioxygenase-like cupin family protein
MAARLTKDGAAGARAEVDARGLMWRAWSNGPRDTYGWHAHEYFKVLVCDRGSITFHTRDGDVAMHAGDRLDLEPATEHAATVGPDGCACAEAWVIDT